MSKMRVNRIKRIIMLLAVCGGSAMMGFVLGYSKVDTAQAESPKLLQRSDEKVIERKESSNEPVAFGNLKVKNAKVVLNQKFSSRSLNEGGGGQEGDWIEGLEFNLKNISSKQITYISLELQFPETEATGPEMVFNQLGIGTYPKALLADKLKPMTPLTLNPGDKATFTLSAKELELIKGFLAFRNFQLADLTKVVVKIVYAVFDDGTKWLLGRNYRPNPDAPGGYEPIDQ